MGNEIKKLVIKVGSSSITYKNGKPNLQRIEDLACVISELKNRGISVILVSSGAIAIGLGRMNLPEKPKDTPTKQALAAIGQCDLMGIYDRFFSEFGYVASQILINRDVIDKQERRENVVNTINKLLEMNTVPIVNENDTISYEEILFGDNDKLSAIAAHLFEADTLIILTDIDGLYDKNPNTDKTAEKIDVVESITEEMLEAAGGSGSKVGTGGMKTKLEAAKYATDRGINVVVMSGENPKDIYKIFENQQLGTFFKAKK